VTRGLAASRRRATLVVAFALAVFGLAACGNGGSSDVEQAQARVSAKERAVTQAEADLAAASDAFCGASKSYVVSVDRYADVLNATTPTVGDVKDAGKDLAAPREDSLAAAEAAVKANDDLVTAEQELADARAALKQAKSGSTGSPTSSGSKQSSAEPTPLAPAATVDRVRSAESDFASAQASITDQTPLAQASQQFNAAAVALEMAWLKLFSDAGCLSGQQQQAEGAVRDYTIALQQALTQAGRYHGEIDGVYGPETVAAVQGLQKANGLPVTGAVDKATAAAMQAEQLAQGGVAAQQALTSTAAVQQTLKLAGFWNGPVDGAWTPALTEALMEFQTELGVKPTGNVDAATVAAMEKAIATSKEPALSGSSDASPSSQPSSDQPSASAG